MNPIVLVLHHDCASFIPSILPTNMAQFTTNMAQYHGLKITVYHCFCAFLFSSVATKARYIQIVIVLLYSVDTYYGYPSAYESIYVMHFAHFPLQTVILTFPSYQYRKNIVQCNMALYSHIKSHDGLCENFSLISQAILH